METTFEQFLTESTGHISVLPFVVNLILTAVLAAVLGVVYTHFGKTLSNRRRFSGNFVLIAMTTMVIITIVKSSLALSLGLVGALSIIRFRTAIKEPEELSYLFFVIAIGLGLGADQVWITLVSFCVIVFIMVVIYPRFVEKGSRYNLFMTVYSDDNNRLDGDQVISTLTKHFEYIHLKRLEEYENSVEVSFLIEASQYDKISIARKELTHLYPNVKTTFIDNKELF